MKKEWFEGWFDSPYYHLLYKARDEQEAKASLDSLLKAIDLPANARIMDLACGKGRHARYLAQKGFEVTGLDISERSITHARQFESDKLEFYQHDMRKPFRINYFDGILNMFTSFGYFESDHEHGLAIQSIASNLRSGGVFLLDYFNSQWIREQLVEREEKTVDGVAFSLHKWIDQGYVHKKVTLEQEGQPMSFTEMVRLFELKDFQEFYKNSKLQITHIFGDYALNDFDPQRSPRLIMVAEKE